jgi:alkyl hydroperoxide reductase subunit AhpC
MSFSVGKPAPDAAAEAYIRGEAGPREVRLADYRGQWVVLFFYPRDFTFVCPTEIQAFARLHADFTAEGAAVLGASTDSYYAHKAWFETDPRLAMVAYPVLADTAQTVAAAFGVLLEDGTALRATFIVDPEGTVRHAQINDLDVGRNIDETLRLLRALKTGELCPAAWNPGTPTLTDVLEQAEAAPAIAPAAASGLARVTDDGVAAVQQADRGVLVLTKNDCGHCAAYGKEIEALLAAGELDGVAIAKLVLNEDGATRFKRANPWLSEVTTLPYTVLYERGVIVARFAGSKASYLQQRLEASFGDSGELKAA